MNGLRIGEKNSKIKLIREHEKKTLADKKDKKIGQERKQK
jgi:hypothetical protein